MYASSRVRKIVRAQDALTHTEEAVYDALWGSKNTSKDSQRLTSMGYREIAKVARVTRQNAQLIIERLIFKGFAKIHTPANIFTRTPTKYIVYSYRSALDNMGSANRSYVVKSGNGVLFAHRMEDRNLPRTILFAPSRTVLDDPARPVLDEPVGAVLTGQTRTLPAAQPDTIPAGQSGTGLAALPPLGNNPEACKPSSSAAPPLVVHAVFEALGYADDDAARRIAAGCRANAPDATDEEIADFIGSTAERMAKISGIENPMGFLIRQVAKCFEGEAFRQYRAAEQRRREAEQQRREAQLASQRELEAEWRRMLEDPSFSEDDREFARKMLE